MSLILRIIHQSFVVPCGFAVFNRVLACNNYGQENPEGRQSRPRHRFTCILINLTHGNAGRDVSATGGKYMTGCAIDGCLHSKRSNLLIVSLSPGQTKLLECNDTYTKQTRKFHR